MPVAVRRSRVARLTFNGERAADGTVAGHDEAALPLVDVGTAYFVAPHLKTAAVELENTRFGKGCAAALASWHGEANSIFPSNSLPLSSLSWVLQSSLGTMSSITGRWQGPPPVVVVPLGGEETGGGDSRAVARVRTAFPQRALATSAALNHNLATSGTAESGNDGGQQSAAATHQSIVHRNQVLGAMARDHADSLARWRGF